MNLKSQFTSIFGAMEKEQPTSAPTDPPVEPPTEDSVDPPLSCGAAQSSDDCDAVGLYKLMCSKHLRENESELMHLTRLTKV